MRRFGMSDFGSGKRVIGKWFMSGRSLMFKGEFCIAPVAALRALVLPVILAVAGCAGSGEPVNWAVRSEPAVLAQTCKIATPAQNYELNSGRATLLRTSNDGSCAFSLYRLQRGAESERGGLPYDSVRIMEQPLHGRVAFIRTETATWVEYRPLPGYLGQDHFAFTLAPGYGYYPVDVQVVAPVEAPAAAYRAPPDVMVYFDFDSARLTADARAALDRLIPAVTEPGYRVWRLDVSGHTDGSGAERYNERLGERRAVAVRDYIAARAGIDPRRMNVSGYGMSILADPKRPLDAVNRRVHVTLVPATLGTVKAQP